MTLLTVLLPGCSSLGALAGKALLQSSDPMLGVNTEVVGGDKTQAVQMDTLSAPQKFDETEVQGDMTVSQETQKGNRDIVTDEYTEGIPYWQASLGGILLLLVGMFMPQLAVRKK